MVKVIVILALICGILLALALAIVGNHSVDVLAEQAQQPASAAEIILQSRQTVPAASADQSAFSGAGLLALILVLLGAVLFLMRGSADFLKQLRLIRKRPSRRRKPTPYVPTWIEPSRTPSVPQLPEGNHEPHSSDFE